jgi:tetratricopeptide (TPR) repeat protein
MKIYLFLGLTILTLGCNSGKKEETNQVVAHRDLDSLIKVNPSNVSLLIERGNKYLKNYNYDKALADGAKAFRLDSLNINARSVYAEALNNRAARTVVDVATAQKHFQHILKKQPGNKKIYISLASTYTQQGDFEKSFKYINDALRIDNKYRDAYVMKGTNYLTLGNRALAKSSYETAVQQDPQFFEGYLQLGFLFSDENSPLAIEYFRTAASLRPTSVDALYGVAYSLQQQRKFDESLRAYKELLQVKPRFYLALFNAGYIKQFEQNQLDSAEYYYKGAIELEPKFVKGWHNLGLCYATKGRKVDAYKAFATALKYNPDFELSRIEANKLR